MTESTALDRLMDEVPVGQAPIDRLLVRGRAAKRRKRRTFVAGAAAATALVVGGGALATHGISGSSGDRDSDVPVVAEPRGRDLAVQVTVGVPKPLAALTTETQAGSVALWNADDRTLAFVPAMGYSSSCPPSGTAESTAGGAVILIVRDDPAPGPCTADNQPVTLTIDVLTDAPAELTVTVSGATTTVPVIYGFADENGLVEVTTDDGQRGFARVKDVMWGEASSPAEARRLLEEHVNKDGNIVVPVYEADGKTLLGHFTAGHVSQ